MKIKRHSEENWLDGWTYMGTLQANAASAEGGEAEAVEEEEEAVEVEAAAISVFSLVINASFLLAL